MDLKQSLYIEHLEELSILYERHRMLSGNPHLKWLDFSDLEQRFEPHIDALVIGEDEALVICEQRMIEGDYGERYGALRVMCRQNRHTMLEDCLGAMDLGDRKNIRAASDALCQDLPTSFQDECIRFLLKNSPEHIQLGARIIAFRRLDFAQELFDALRRYPEEKETVLCLLHALGRLRPRYGAEFLLNFLHSPHEDVVDAAVTALVRIGERRALNECMAFIGPGDWPKLCLGLYGGKNVLTDSFFSVSNLDETEAPTQSHDQVIALGLLGNITAVPQLIDCLDNPELSATAALCLNLMTGAERFEDLFVPDVIDPKDLFDDERERWEKGLLYPPGKEPGSMVHRLSQKPEDWKAWWRKEQRRFDPEMRYRNGKLYSPACLLENLKSPDSPNLIRQLAHEELVIRYGIDVPFETHMTVFQQLRAIETMMIRLKNNPDGFEEGLWYYNGKPITEDLLSMVRDAQAMEEVSE